MKKYIQPRLIIEYFCMETIAADSGIPESEYLPELENYQAKAHVSFYDLIAFDYER